MAAAYIIGIDEVGRGPLAGPVTLCACAIPRGDVGNLFIKILHGVKDSKKLTPHARAAFFAKAKQLRRENKINYAIAHVSAAVIDREGIASAIRIAITRCLQKLELDPVRCSIFLDGSLKVPQKFVRQKTIIGGDQSIPVISLASIIAKVARDKKMVGWARAFPQYGFEIHKGYGTLAHRDAIRRHGLSPLHRRTFCRNIDN